MHDDVVVVGGGLAGMTAALAAAREDADVRILTHKENTLRSASGLIDVLGYLPGDTAESGSGPLEDPFDHLDALPDDHPYRVVGEATIRDALALFDEVTDDTYAGGHTDVNALLPTFGGTLKPTARYPTSSAPGLASRATDTLLVGFDQLVDFDAPAAADRLEAAGVPFSVRGVTLEFPGQFRADAKLTRYVHALDHDEAVEVSGSAVNAGTTSREEPIRTALSDPVSDALDGEGRVGFPAILGDDAVDDARDELSSRLGVDVFEVPMGPPSIPGLRLQNTFDDALREHGVVVESGNPAVGYETDDHGNLTAVLVDRKGAELPYHADQFVLATGGLVGKGIETDRETASEPVFDCHVDHPAERYEWFSMDAFGDHEFARFGVHPDDDLRPIDETLEPEYDNIRAAGAVLGGYDSAAEKSGSGVSLATGFAAGTAAAREL